MEPLRCALVVVAVWPVRSRLATDTTAAGTSRFVDDAAGDLLVAVIPAAPRCSWVMSSGVWTPTPVGAGYGYYSRNIDQHNGGVSKRQTDRRPVEQGHSLGNSYP